MPSALKAEQPDFIASQYAFAARIRDPLNAPAPADVEPRRMAVYEELFFGNIKEVLGNTFPVLKSVMDPANWEALARDFFRDHRCQSPLYLQVPREFLHYLESERSEKAGDPPFMLELAHYEWLELALAIAEEEPGFSAPPQDRKALLDGSPRRSPLAWPVSYRFAVQRIGADRIPEAPEPQPVHLVIYRDRDDAVGFLELNPVSARLLQLIDMSDGRTPLQLLEQIAAELNHPNPRTVVEGGLALLDDLARRDVIIYGR